MDYPRSELQQHMLQPNLSLNTVRQTKMPLWEHAVIANTPTPAVFVEIKDGSSAFPLYLYPEPDEREDGQRRFPAELTGQGGRKPNFSKTFWQDVCDRLNGQWVPDGHRKHEPPSLDDPFEITPEDLFHYIYAVVHSPTYRSRYTDSSALTSPAFPSPPTAPSSARWPPKARS